MAENAANFTTTIHNRPSIFEIIAQKSLNDTLYPALQKVALFLSSSFPRKFGFLNLYYDEAFLACNGLLQFYYLKYYDASFSENFYGLKRLLSNGTQLTKREKEISLLFLVAVPYLKKKLEEKIQIYRIENAEGQLTKNFESRSKKLLIYAHSTFEVLWSLATLNSYLKYMSEQTDIQIPLLNILGLKFAYSNEEPSLSFWSALFRGNLKLSDINFGLARNAVSTVLETAAFFMQFLQVWNSQKPNFAFTYLPKVEPPSYNILAKHYKGKCKICYQTWVNPTILPVSGYIFCFRCIAKHINETKTCPVTNLPAMLSDIVRIFDD
ncbi:peroxisome assembly protein 12 [Euwallacea fornicatus]|uniref:peroxisome assembly protein 12 n=1 Tax=Euwallacea fornicatus TaxID=995702 RepID=UPI00338ED3EC